MTELRADTTADGARIEDPGNPDAWIEADYREGWVGRKLLVEDKTAYEEMIDPYYLKCRACHRYDSPQLWGANSEYCPGCEQQIKFGIPMAFELLFGAGGRGRRQADD